ncbi:MAG: adenosylcobalamin-dependent ribonucleoside-diphosphate reductase [Firmicutes bacterium]|jgi:ribonucleoside-diphosphate reductase alpha chain|nr:adenosylcobalamin-dependent ribonucleoside-diphosphate reductase [Bacillota bacterium]
MKSIPDSVLECKMSLTPEALTIMESRYLLKDKEGSIVETPEEMCLRVAREAARAGVQYEGVRESESERVKLFYWLLVNHLFSPNSPTWMNAGTGSAQNAACFVLPVEDSLPQIFDAVRGAALIHQSGGGTGFDFSSLRPHGDVVRSTGGVASGPVSFMAVFNAATETIKQGGKRRGANIGILRVDHPDIESFITCKVDNTALSNFNISVGITDAFIGALEADAEYELINPRTKSAVGTKRARDVFNLIVDHAWKNGEPGVVFLDRIEEGNPTPSLGRISATNPCGEQPLLPYEACNLGSVNLQKIYLEEPLTEENLADALGTSVRDFLLGGDFGERCQELVSEEMRHVDWDLLRTVIHASVDFLDSIIDVSEYPLSEIGTMVRTTRKIGLGFMGLADLLILLATPYASEKAEVLAELIAKFITYEARAKSRQMAEERGAFPAFEKSIFAKAGEVPLRNATVTTVAPTGTISMVANASSGCEPLFGVAFTKRNILGGKSLTQVNSLFLADAKERGIYSDELMERIAENGGSLAGIDDIPSDMAELYQTALEIPWEWHVRIQAAVQRGIDNAVSKTINLPNDATREAVGEAYKLAHSLGCKGLTVYRTGSREIEVISSKKVELPLDAELEPPTPRGRKPFTVDSSLWGTLQPIDRPETLCGITKRIATPSGTLWATLNMYDGKPFEMFCQIGRAGTDIYAFTESIARLISLALRAGIDPSVVVRQLRGIGGSGQVGFGPNKVLSVPDAIGRMLEQCIQSRYAGIEWATPPERGIAGQVPPENSWESADVDISPDEAIIQRSLLFADGEDQSGTDAAAALETGDPMGEAVADLEAQQPSGEKSGRPINADADDVAASARSSGSANGAGNHVSIQEPGMFTAPSGTGGHMGDADYTSSGQRVTRHDLCPQCGNYSLVYASGCSECRLCGYSAC